MSCVVLHMDKYKREAVRGIQSHNQRERKSRSNPDIDSERSSLNYDLYHEGRVNFTKIIDQRIDSLNLKRAPRHDAVLMCGIIVSSDSEFFQKLSKPEQRRFFRAAKEWLEEFVGRKNVIAATVHLDEKTPHLHFSHVPVTEDGRLCAKDIYTRASLKRMQSDFPKYLQSCGFNIERGVAQEQGSAKKHLDTREFKQQREALNNLRREVDSEAEKLAGLRTEVSRAESDWQKRFAGYEIIAAEAEAILADTPKLPAPGLLKAQAIHDAATSIIELYQKALADKLVLKNRNQWLEKQQREIDQIIAAVEAKAAEEMRRHDEEAKKREAFVKAKLHQVTDILSTRDQTIRHLMEQSKILMNENDRLKKLEEEWESQKRMEAFKKERQAPRAPELRPSPKPAPPRQEQNQGMSR